MKREELAALPEGTTLYCISRKISKSGMRQVFDVFYLTHEESWNSDRCPVHQTNYRTNWIRISRDDAKAFSAVATCRASTSWEQDRKLGGTFYVNGCGFNRPAEVVESLSRWATGEDRYFRCEML